MLPGEWWTGGLPVGRDHAESDRGQCQRNERPSFLERHRNPLDTFAASGGLGEVKKRPADLTRSYQRIQPSLPDAPHGNGHLLLALGLTMDSSAVLAEVVKRGGGRIVL